MTTNTTKQPRADAKPDKARASKTQPGIVAPPAPPVTELESRIKVRRAELVTKLRELRADARAEAHEAGDKLKAKLSEVGHIIKDGVVDGWASVGDTVKHKLERWLTESARQLPTPEVPPPPVAPQDASAKTGQS